MSSERPKLGLDVAKVVTGWDSRTGRVVYMTASRDWSETLADAIVMSGLEAQSALAFAARDQVRVSDPYFMQVTQEGAIAGREMLRETIRARGPTNHPMFGKQAGNP
jgi:hypothetical protein